MSSTYASLHYHIVFSTKHRKPWIGEAWRHRLHEYLGGTARGLDAYPQSVGGVADHVHLLVGLSPKQVISDFLRELKKNSSKWVHSEIACGEFAWQEGYAIFTVSPTARDDVRKYIEHQEAHHKTKSFREELIELLERAGVEYDPRYLD